MSDGRPGGLLNRQTAGRLLVGATLGGVALWLTFRRTDLRLVVTSVERVHPLLVLLALALVATTVTAVARRWQLLVCRGEAPRRLPRFLAAVVTSQMLNVVLPIRLGEAARAYWISRTEHRPLGRIVATIVVERLADVLMLGVSVSVLLVYVALPSWARHSGEVALGASLAAAAAAIVLGKWGASVLRALEWPLLILPERMRMVLIQQGRVALAELRAFGGWRSNLTVWALSVLIVTLAAATNYVLFLAFDLPLPPTTALLVFVVLQIGGAPASTPGNLGVFHYLTVLVLTAFGVDRTVAVAYAIVLHAVAVGPKIIAGAVMIGLASTSVFEPAGWRQSVLQATRSPGG